MADTQAGPQRTVREQISSLAAVCRWALEHDPAGANVGAHYERVLRDVGDRLLAIHRELPAALAQQAAAGGDKAHPTMPEYFEEHPATPPAAPASEAWLRKHAEAEYGCESVSAGAPAVDVEKIVEAVEFRLRQQHVRTLDEVVLELRGALAAIPATPTAPDGRAVETDHTLNPAQQQLANELDQCISILEGQPPAQPAAPEVDVEALIDAGCEWLQQWLAWRNSSLDSARIETAEERLADLLGPIHADRAKNEAREETLTLLQNLAATGSAKETK